MKKFKVLNREDILKVINYLNIVNVEKPLEVSVKPYKPNRSAAQNRIFWEWMGIMGNDIGYTSQEMHDNMCHKFLGYTESVVMGDIIIKLRGTSDLKVKPFAELLTQIEIFAASDLGIVLPSGDDLYWEAMGIKRR